MLQKIINHLRENFIRHMKEILEMEQMANVIMKK